MFLALTGAQGVTLSVCPWGTSLSRVHNLHPACTIDRNFYRDAILDALLLLLLREQTTAFVRVYHLQLWRDSRRKFRRDSRRDWSSGAWMCQAYYVKVSSKSESPFVFTDREKRMLLLLLLSVPCSTQGPVCGDFWSSGA